MNHEHKLEPASVLVEASTMAFGDPELISTACPACGCSHVFIAVAPPGHREMPLYPACCRCRRERDDLADFYADPPTQPSYFAVLLE
jgi:hypothetical protein